MECSGERSSLAPPPYNDTVCLSVCVCPKTRPGGVGVDSNVTVCLCVSQNSTGGVGSGERSSLAPPPYSGERSSLAPPPSEGELGPFLRAICVHGSVAPARDAPSHFEHRLLYEPV